MNKYSYNLFFLIPKIFLLAGIIFLISCSPIKYVPDDKFLLNKVKLDIDNKEINKEEISTYLKQKDNYKIFGFLRFHLFVYNLSSKKKENSWLKKIGEPPQVYDEGMENKSKEQLLRYLHNKGYYRAEVTSKSVFQNEKRKVNLTYYLKTGGDYKINNINYIFLNDDLKKIFDERSNIEKINAGAPFDIQMLENYRNSLVDIYRNKGYYYFNKEEIRYKADTNLVESKVKIDIYIGLNNNREDSAKIYSLYKVKNFTIDISPLNSDLGDMDKEKVTSYDALSANIVINQSGNNLYRKNIYRNAIRIDTNALYSSRNVERTYRAFNRLQQFRYIDIQFQETPSPEDTNKLECSIKLAPLSKQSIGFDVEGTNTSANMGVAGNLNYMHRNLFKGAEIFQVKLRGAIERQQNFYTKGDIFNTKEIGFETSVKLPVLLGPGSIIPTLRSRQTVTNLAVSYNYQNRPEYTRTIANIKMGYSWLNERYKNHLWNIVDFNIVNILNQDTSFIERIKDEYIKSSFTDHLILAMNYTYTFNNQQNTLKRDYKYLRINFESAGNLLDVLCNVAGKTQIETYDEETQRSSTFYRILNTRFAQYLKTDAEFRYGKFIDKYNSIVGRFFMGLGIPYGNFEVLPFEKRYFTGGANGIRAWQVRSLGPGAYRDSVGFYPNQSSDIKLEGNIEYRFNLLKYVEGAFFLDAGNIWAVNKNDNRKEALFYWNKFYKQIALGTGAGLRFDFNYFIFRLDLGMKLHDPSQKYKNGWIIGKRKLVKDDFALFFAIGYPF